MNYDYVGPITLRPSIGSTPSLIKVMCAVLGLSIV